VLVNAKEIEILEHMISRHRGRARGRDLVEAGVLERSQAYVLLHRMRDKGLLAENGEAGRPTFVVTEYGVRVAELERDADELKKRLPAWARS
jgi:DNA-binding IclR family transcriptional regulator